MTTELLVVIAAGGTGGHVFSGLAVAERLSAMRIDVVWFGSNKGMEADAISRTSYPFECITISGVRRTGWLNWLLLPWRMTVAVWQACRLLRKHHPNMVLGMGGFVAGPVGLAAYLLRIPLVIHEQNAVVGLTNRYLAKLSRRVLLGYSGVMQKRAEWVGNPVRANLLELRDENEPRERLLKRSGALRLLVVGGSRGAQALNEMMPRAIADASAPIEVWHQTGRDKGEGVDEAYRRNGIPARVDEFIDDMAAALLWADVVICRSGAQTLAELATLGVASILVPFPHAVDDHQTRNAIPFLDHDAAIVWSQAELTERAASAQVSELALSRERLASMASRARRLAKPNAATRVAEVCREVMAA